ncbi:MAG TPA: hypothetical protein VD866_22730 [Urbifossiella sp.]|nr:hypothetical protein [Urbifossiella sp.]
MATALVPVADLTPDLLRGVSWVRARDPRGPGFTARFNLRPGEGAGSDAPGLEVAIDRGRLDADLAILRAVSGRQSRRAAEEFVSGAFYLWGRRRGVRWSPGGRTDRTTCHRLPTSGRFPSASS